MSAIKCKEKLEKTQCRTCYNATKGLKVITNLTKCCGKPQQQKSYAQLITEVSSINIMDNSYKDLPQFICKVCSRKLKAAHAFIQQTHEVNGRLVAMLTDREYSNKQLDCLQETQVDIKSCLEIKIEDANAGICYQADEKYNVKLKIEELEFSQNLLADDVFCDVEDSDKMNIKEAAALGKSKCDAKLPKRDTENENYKEILNGAATKNVELKTGSESSTDYKSNENESHCGTDGVVSDAEVENKLVWQKKEEKYNFENSISIRTRKAAEMILTSIDDEDVAVPCSQCNKIFKNSKALVRHQRTSHIPEDQKCTCPLCFRKFSRSCNMYTHMRTFHGPETVPFIRKPSTQERIFQCDKCPRNYTKRKHLNIHIKNKHSQENESNEKNSNKLMEDKRVPNNELQHSQPNKPKRYEVRSLCSICGSSFSSKTHLIVHMRRHTGERPFKCDLCDRAYPRISELTCHRRIHTGEKPFACKICGKTFRVSSKMTTHMRSHTDLRPYKCTQCERSFKYSKDLSIHFRIHTGERPYSCDVCGSTFTQSNTLKAHRVKLGHVNVLEKQTV